jgi:hypothetical protein
MAGKRKLLVVSVAGLDAGTASGLTGLDAPFSPLRPTFPAVTCAAQAAFRTGLPASGHGMTGNGFFDHRLRKAFFWEQSSALVDGSRFWEQLRHSGGTVGLLFWQQAMGEEADVIVTPAPIHKHHGGMILDCYSQPAGLYPRLRARLGEFPLHRYWGPFASPSVGNWIAEATADVMAHEAPDLLLTYLPTLDYDFQRYGPTHRQSQPSIAMLNRQLQDLLKAARETGYEWMIWGDYAIEPCTGGASFPNRALRDAGLLACREVRGRLYADLNASRAFALVDHAVAQVYAKSPSDAVAAREVLRDLPGVGKIVAKGQSEGDPQWRDAEEMAGNPRAGDLVLIAAAGSWFAYPWWTTGREAPDYARHVDIHNKPGYDPCELTKKWIPPGIGTDPTRVRGTHGRTDRPAAWACSWDIERGLGRAASPLGAATGACEITVEALSAAAAGFFKDAIRKEQGR